MWSRSVPVSIPEHGDFFLQKWRYRYWTKKWGHVKLFCYTMWRTRCTFSVMRNNKDTGTGPVVVQFLWKLDFWFCMTTSIWIFCSRKFGRMQEIKNPSYPAVYPVHHKFLLKKCEVCINLCIFSWHAVINIMSSVVFFVPTHTTTYTCCKKN